MARRSRRRRRHSVASFGSAGINRHRERNGRVRHRRSSAPRWPRPCVGVREDDGEALDRGTCRQGYGAAKSAFRGADAVRMSGRQHRRRRQTREPSADPARSENLCMQGVSMRENREIPHSPVPLIGGGPPKGRLRPHAWDVRAWEVGSPRSTDEAAEQGDRCGGGGGKGARRGEPGRHDTPRTQSRVRRATRAGSGAPYGCRGHSGGDHVAPRSRPVRRLTQARSPVR